MTPTLALTTPSGRGTMIAAAGDASTGRAYVDFLGDGGAAKAAYGDGGV